MNSILIGDIFLTRNTDEVGNDNPGYYNHVAIMSENLWVVEAQYPVGVIAVPWKNFFERYPEILVRRNKNSIIGTETGKAAWSFLGTPYRKITSYRPRWHKITGDNCVSLLRRIYLMITNIDMVWRKPDDLLVDLNFDSLFEKKEYETYQKPNNWLEGAITAPPY